MAASPVPLGSLGSPWAGAGAGAGAAGGMELEPVWGRKLYPGPMHQPHGHMFGLDGHPHHHRHALKEEPLTSSQLRAWMHQPAPQDHARYTPTPSSSQ